MSRIRKSVTPLVFSVVFLVFALPLHAVEPSVSVSARGTASVKPDIAGLQIRLIATARTAEQATALTAKKYQSVQQALRNSGVSAGDAVTYSYTVSQEWEWNNTSRKRVFKGYTATHVLKVTVRKLDNTGRVIDAAVQAGADGIPVIGFSSSRYKEKRRDALADAVRNARKDAEAMASAAGMSLGALQEMRSGAAPVYPVRDMMRSMGEKAVAVSAPTEISPGEQEIGVTVNCTWSLAGK